MSKIIALCHDDGTWGVYTHGSSHYHLLRGGLTESGARMMAAHLNAIIESKDVEP